MPATILEMFRSGLDTMQIAERLGMAESAVAHDLHAQRSAEMGLPSGYVEPPSW